MCRWSFPRMAAPCEREVLLCSRVVTHCVKITTVTANAPVIRVSRSKSTGNVKKSPTAMPTAAPYMSKRCCAPPQAGELAIFAAAACCCCCYLCWLPLQLELRCSSCSLCSVCGPRCCYYSRGHLLLSTSLSVLLPIIHPSASHHHPHPSSLQLTPSHPQSL